MFFHDLMWYVVSTVFMGFCLMIIVVPTRRAKLGWNNPEDAHHATGKQEFWTVIFGIAFIIWVITAWLMIKHVGVT